MSKVLKPTSQQSLAAEPARSVWVSANAGTGKTRVLVDRIARLLLAGAAPEKILCLTFTKTAAAEMAARINTQLGDWAVMADADLVDSLRVLTGTPPDDGTVRTARTLFARVLDVPGGLKIRTIHSFCEGLIGRFPIEAGVAPNFTVIDERSSAELLGEAKERILGRTVSDPESPLARALTHLAELVNEDDFARLMQTLTGKRERLRDVLHHFARFDSLNAALTDLVGLAPEDTDDDAILRAALTPGVLDELSMTRAAKALEQGSPTSKKNAQKLKEFLAMDIEGRIGKYDETYLLLFLTQKGEPASADRTMTSKDAREADPALQDIMIAEQARVLAVQDKRRARATADATASLLEVGRAMLDAYEHLKAVRAWLDYDDLIDKARALLTTFDGGVSWVHYKLDGGIDHILVDESQDTSPAQWDVVKSLAEDFYAGLSRHEEVEQTPRTVFAVGDEKQSIYSFQGADPHEFGRMRDHFEARVRAAQQDFTDVTLNVSFRSTPAVLDMVDKVFAQPGAADGLTFADQRADHRSSRQGEAGLVEVWPTETATPSDDDDPWDAPLDYKGEASPEQRLAHRIAATVKDWIEGGEVLTALGRPMTAGDVLILVRERGSFAEAQVRALKKLGINVAGADRMVLTDQMAVMDLLAAGRFAVLPEDDLSLAELLKSPLVGLDEDALFDLAYGRKGGLWAELRSRRAERDDFARAHVILAELLARADTVPPYEFYAGLLRDGGRQAFLARLGADAEDPIDEFLGAALTFEHNHTPSLQRFLHWVTATSQTIKRDMETTRDEVRVMTVHGAKGLEAPVVFLADTCKVPDAKKLGRVQWSRDGSAPGVLWSPAADQRCRTFTDWMELERTEQNQEYRRLLYVAMTRARDRLYVTGFHKGETRPEGCWYDMIQPVIADLGREVACPSGTGWRFETEQSADVKPPEPKAPAAETGAPPAWRHAPAPAESTPPDPLTPSRPTPEDPPALGPFDAADEGRFQRGLLIHKLLETLPALPPQQRRTAGARWLAQPAHDLESDAQSALLDETMAVLEHPDLTDLFAPDGLAEVALSGVLGGRVVSARLDRLAVTESRVDVVDYKTNRPAPTEPENVPEAYLAQMATYRALLAELYPGRRIRCVLLWTDGPHAMVLDDAILRDFAPDGGAA